MRAFVVAGTQSGVGKTTVTLGLLAALRRRGFRVQGFKVGPDFIDPGYHAVATGNPSYNLDGWMLEKEYNLRSFGRRMQGKDVGVVEGVMGLFDGYGGGGEAGSTAEMAKWLGLPVVLVVDASAMARSVAALVWGFQHFDPELKVAGVIFNRVGGPGHLRYLKEALEENPTLTVLGGLPYRAEIRIPERHLGLTTQEEFGPSPQWVERLASFVEEHLDLDRLLGMSRVGAVPVSASDPCPETPKGQRVRLGVAKDEAFCFYYSENLELLEAAGAELVFFSPLRDPTLPPDLQGLYLGGGYPELHAERLSANQKMRKAVQAFIEGGGVVYAECGGLMYLSQGIRSLDGALFPMVGIYPATACMLSHLKALGYVEAEIRAPYFRGKVRGHEFHYSELEVEGFSRPEFRQVYRLRPRPEDLPRLEGYLYKRCLASYVHLHFGSNPAFASALVQAAGEKL